MTILPCDQAIRAVRLLQINGSKEHFMANVQSPKQTALTPPRRGAIGKAFLVYLASGSVGVAVIAYLIFAGAGC